jgi:hypothetical protein
MEEQFTNQSEQEVIEETPVTEEVQETEQEDTQEAPDTAQDSDFFEVKYNKENMRISRDEAPTYIQKGLNYDKVQQKASDYENHLQKVAQITGYGSIDELIQASQQFEEQQRIQQEAEKLRIDETVYRQHFEPVNQELMQVRTELQKLQHEKRMNEIDSEINSLRSKYEDFGKYEDQVFQTAIERGYKLEDAYKLVTYEDRIQNIARQKEQEVLAQVTGRDEKQIISSNDKAGSTNFDPAIMSLKDIEALSERVKRGERITF